MTLPTRLLSLLFLFTSSSQLYAVEYVYDDFGKLKTTTYSNVIISYEYDDASNLTSVTYALLGTENDSDGDKVEDKWEQDNNLNPFDKKDAEEDEDQDGQNNLREYIAGTNPLDPESVFQITEKIISDEVENSTITIKWNSVEGKIYKVEYSTNLVDWYLVEDSISATAPLNSIEIDTENNSKVFYRIGISQ